MGNTKLGNRVYWLIGLIGSLLGLSCGIIAWQLNAMGVGRTLLVPATLAGLMCALLCWVWLIAWRKHETLMRGIWAGSIAGLIAHPLTWYLAVIRANINFYFIPWCDCPEAPVGLLAGIPQSILLSYLSLFPLGWMTLVLGAVAGAGLVYYYQHRS
ncbi:MAG: hypothetical protein Tsb005_01980 [Gammaproteobacteria bacterium]